VKEATSDHKTIAPNRQLEEHSALVKEFKSDVELSLIINCLLRVFTYFEITMWTLSILRVTVFTG